MATIGPGVHRSQTNYNDLESSFVFSVPLATTRQPPRPPAHPQGQGGTGNSPYRPPNTTQSGETAKARPPDRQRKEGGRGNGGT